MSYACHYRSLDSTEYYAQRAFSASPHYDDGRAEALNNLAFVRMAQMRYGEARQLLGQIPAVTDNQLELLVAYVQQMRLCQRMSENRAFYDYREQALRSLHRIREEQDGLLDERQQARLVYAESELAIVTATYYYYVGLERQSTQALKHMPPAVDTDTAQHLNYLYYVGSGGVIVAPTEDAIIQQEFDCLMRCLLLAQQVGCVYFEANALEALAEHLTSDDSRQRLMADNLPAFKYFDPDGMATDSLPLMLASRSLEAFTQYGDVYQIAGAHRTLASCYLARGDYENALLHLEKALQDTLINQAPDLVASIREQLSVAYAAVDDKPASDMNRNIYLDLQEQTRQDRSLEARAGQLEQAARQLNWLIVAVVGAIIVFVVLMALFYRRHRRHLAVHGRDDDLQQQEDDLHEQLAMVRLRVEKGERLALEQRAKVSLVNSITPLIDRMLHETTHLSAEGQEYIAELADNISEQNDVLTRWIQLRQGELSLHIETFPLQQLFDIVAKGYRSFAMKGIELQVQPTTARVKADRVLTLFMLNTLADNARKFTQEGGHVDISATEGEDYVEVAVGDTGIGMDADQLAHVFDRKLISDDKGQTSHGFGLANCKGIIDKYRKTSRIFSVCSIAAESTKGAGSRFTFRLPRGMARLLAILATATAAAGPMEAQTQHPDLLSRASAYADSAYFSNIGGTFERTLQFADSCRTYLNRFYRLHHPASADTLLGMGNTALEAPEIHWLRDSLHINYDIVLTMRNESAVAALALHRWTVYQYNNRIYTQLFKEMSADTTLDDYCRRMQQSQMNKQVAIILLVLLFVAFLVAVAWQLFVSLGKAAHLRQEKEERLEMLRDELNRMLQEEDALHVGNAVLDNCLSALKHETMYYPSRIRQLVQADDTAPLPEVVAYYREIYGILSTQATRMTESVRLHLQHLDHEVQGDAVLMDYLFELLRKQVGKRSLDMHYELRDDKYVVCTVDMPGLELSQEQAVHLFTPQGGNIPFLLCRQIVRDHGEATNRRACAIRAEADGKTTKIIITLPRIWNHSKSSL